MNKALFSINADNPGFVEVETLETVEGLQKVSKKTMFIDDFMSLFCNSLTTNKKISIGKLPNGFYNGTIDLDGKGFQCLIVVPEGIKPLIYYDSTYNVPFPTLFFYFQVRNGKLEKSAVFSLSSDNVSDSSFLYNYPYGNVYDDGKICWGGNAIRGIKSLRETESIVSTFFGSPTNNDLWHMGENIATSGNLNCNIAQRGLLENLCKKDKFPKNLLVKRTITVKDLLQKVGVV